MKKRKINKTKVQAKKSISASTIQHLRALSDQIGEIIPATSFRKGGFCFRSIAKQYGCQKYLLLKDSKKETIFGFLAGVYKYHPRIFYKIFRENIAQGIERRHKAGNPVLLKEIEEMNDTLKILGINLGKEMKALNLPKERPTIVPPPHEFKQMIDKLALHPFLQPDCFGLFKDGHINDSVRKALEKYEVYIQRKSTSGAIGADLMSKAFNEKDPLIKIADIETERGKGLQMGFRFISMGAMSFWRNFCSHGDEAQMPHQDAIAVLSTVSHLLYYVDNNSKDIKLSEQEIVTQ